MISGIKNHKSSRDRVRQQADSGERVAQLGVVNVTRAFFIHRGPDGPVASFYDAQAVPL
jgi:hypothetical protein